ncbi:hypothetical protein A1O1_06421 [Capronia coronata CBS 617.96]|uniref:Uncharacterized protein n=1 Tax=Capronia coronata CBS 617.96 TaxID=1182541 RepID=W9XZR5_9EURO|nr:uncharacterized protein A1O1_06421 [Capronia coronata CBS 617.96]EXJ86052.1 hypothetical protein A1O1_06421 [Capronia coronata CBS 617.96]
MTSLIFGSIWLGHKGLVKYKRDKQRQKNYERWEGLRDDYDEQRKITREAKSLEIQRTGASYVDPDADRPILTLRDQQEANDARTSWRPQEAWDGPISPVAQRTSVEVIAGSGLRPVVRHKTGSTWDEDLPQPLRVSRRTFDGQQTPNMSADVSRSGSVRTASNNNAAAAASGMYSPGDRSRSNTPSLSQRTSPRPNSVLPTSSNVRSHSRSVSVPTNLLLESIEPLESTIPGGKMAELIELGNSRQQQQQQQQQPSPFNSPPLQPYNNPPPPPQQLQPLYTSYQTSNPFMTQQNTIAPQQPLPQPLVQSVSQQQQPPQPLPLSPTFPPSNSQTMSPTFPPPMSPPMLPTGYPAPISQPQPQPQANSQPFGTGPAQPVAQGMEEWWNRP